MPSNKNPNSSVQPNAGRLPAGVVPASALMFPPSGGDGGQSEALNIHIENPTDAHLASAIGIGFNNDGIPVPGYDAIGNPMLSSLGGVVDGESVLDFITAVKDLFPTRPNSLGFDTPLCQVIGVDSLGGLIQIKTAVPTFLLTGDIVNITGVLGTVEANEQWSITTVDATHFTLNESAFVHAYVSGGTVSVNSGLPNWSGLNPVGVGSGSALSGGYAGLSSAAIPSQYIVPSTTTNFGLSGIVFPADRGVLALYKNTDGDFLDSSATTLVSVLGLGSPYLIGIPYAFFNEALRQGQQLDYMGVYSVANVTYNSGSFEVQTVEPTTLVTGQSVTISGVVGSTGINSTWVITVQDSKHFSLQGSTFAGAYASGGSVKTVYAIINVSPNAGYFEITTTLSTTLASGNIVNIAGVVGTPGANGQWTITVIDSTHFTLNGSTYSGLYDGGGTVQNIQDQFSLTWRLPYLNSYAAYPDAPYADYDAIFTRYQIASYQVDSQTIATGGSQSWLLVHWKETYATSTASLHPSNLTLGNLTPTNCYSATPTSNTAYAAGSWDDDTQAVSYINRRNVFQDSASGSSVPTGTVFTAAQNGTPTTSYLSGINYYNTTALSWTVSVQATSLFANSYLTGSVDNLPNVPLGFHSSADPIQFSFAGFGGGTVDVPYYLMNLSGTPTPLYSLTNSPQPGDTGEYSSTSLAIPNPTPYCPVGGYAQLRANFHSVFATGAMINTGKYLYDTYPVAPVYTAITSGSNGLSLPQATLNVGSTSGFSASGTLFIVIDGQPTAITYTSLSGGNTFLGCQGGVGILATGQTVSNSITTTTYEPFVDEFYRYVNSFDPTSGGSNLVSLVPSGGNIFASSSAITGGDSLLQVQGHQLAYPQTDFTNALFHPSQSGVNYSGFPAGDGTHHVRYHQRAIDTSIARNTGWIRLRGLTPANLAANAAWDGVQTTGHITGGVLVQVMVPGTNGTAWLDLGRQLGNPGLDSSILYYGCQTGMIQGPAGSEDIYVSYNTQAFTSNNGSGNFLLFIRVGLINGVGTGTTLTEYEWYDPSFVPPGEA